MGLRRSWPGDPLGIAAGRLSPPGFKPLRSPAAGEEYAPHLAKNKSLYEINFYLPSYTCSPGLYRF